MSRLFRQRYPRDRTTHVRVSLLVAFLRLYLLSRERKYTLCESDLFLLSYMRADIQ